MPSLQPNFTDILIPVENVVGHTASCIISLILILVLALSILFSRSSALLAKLFHTKPMTIGVYKWIEVVSE